VSQISVIRCRTACGAQRVSNTDDALRSDVINQLGDIAIRVGRKIVWDPIKETIVGDDAAARRMARPMREPWRL